MATCKGVAIAIFFVQDCVGSMEGGGSRPYRWWRERACIAENTFWGKRVMNWSARVGRALEEERWERAEEQRRLSVEAAWWKLLAARQTIAAERRALRKARRAEQVTLRVALSRVAADEAWQRWKAQARVCARSRLQEDCDNKIGSVAVGVGGSVVSDGPDALARRGRTRRERDDLFFIERECWGFARSFGKNHLEFGGRAL